MTMIKGTPVDFLELGKVPKSFEPEKVSHAEPHYWRMMVDQDLSIASFVGAWELTHEKLGFIPDTLVISPSAFADWVLNLAERFRGEGYGFTVLVNPNLKHDSWFVARGDLVGYGSEGA